MNEHEVDKIYFSKIKESAKIPTRETYNAGLDIYACFDEDYIIINSGETKLIPTGIFSAIPEQYYIQIYERGSTGSKGIKASAGVIDSSYRGEWFLATTNVNKKPVLISKLDMSSLDPNIMVLLENAYIIYPYEKALFQGVVHSVNNDVCREEINYEDYLKLTSQRGDGKLGSSNK